MPYPEGDSSALARSTADACASRSEHCSHGIETDLSSRIRTRACGVTSIDFAKTYSVLLCTVSSELLPPRIHDLIEVFEDNSPHFAS